MTETFFRKCLIGILCGFIMLAMLPISVHAAEETVAYGIKVVGVVVNEANAADVLGDGTVSYDSGTNTLTLNGTDVHVKKGNYGIRAEGSLNLKLKGANKLVTDDYYGIAIVVGSDGNTPELKICGDGSLTVEGTDDGMLIRGNLTICESAKVVSQCQDVKSGSAYGVRVNGNLVICDKGELVAKSGAAPEYSYGVYAGDKITLSGNAKVTAEAGNGVGRSCGTYAINSITVKDNAQLNTKGIDNSESGDFASESYGIRTTDMFVSGGTVDATGQGANGISAGIYAQVMEISGGTATFNSLDPKAGQSIGVQSTKMLYVSGGKLIANSDDTTADSWAIDASRELKITGGTIIATTGTGDRSYGIYADTANISGGTVKVNANDAESQSRGIQAMNGLTISGGHVEAVSGNANSQSYGIQSSTVIDITGGNVTASSGTARKSSAIYSGNAINMKDTTVAVVSQGNGIYAPYGAIDIGCTAVTVSEDATSLVGTKIVINAASEALSAGTELTIDEKLVKHTPEGDKVVIEPLGYTVTIKGLSEDRNLLVPAGKSVYDTYPDFDNMIDMTKEGYELEGFYTDEACSAGSEYRFDTVVDADITIYAKWVAKTDTGDKPDAEAEPAPSPETGDPFNLELWILLMIAAGIAAITGFKKKNYKY